MITSKWISYIAQENEDKGYIRMEWYEKLHSRDGKGRKYIVLSRRERPVYGLSKMAVALRQQLRNESSDKSAAIDHEFWCILNTDGLCKLFMLKYFWLCTQKRCRCLPVSINKEQSSNRAYAGVSRNKSGQSCISRACLDDQRWHRDQGHIYVLSRGDDVDNGWAIIIYSDATKDTKRRRCGKLWLRTYLTIHGTGYKKKMTRMNCTRQTWIHSLSKTIIEAG